MRPIDADACPALFDAEFKKTRRLILYGEKHLDNLAEGFMEANNVIRSMPTITPPPNDPLTPLTLEELREMDGEPVWISYFAGGPNVCMLVDAKHDVCRDAHGGFAVFENLGRTWIAYRRKPEEGEH